MIKEINLDNIESITLLSIEEYKKYRDKISPVEGKWWLRSPGDDDILAACVNGESGDVIANGRDVLLEFGVRPALQISNPESLKPGEEFIVGENSFTYLGEGLALCNNCIGKCAFRDDLTAPDANVYEKSDIKIYVENWFEKTKEKGITITISPELERKIVAFCDDELNYHIHESGCAEEYKSEIEAQIELLRLLGQGNMADEYEREFNGMEEPDR